MIASMSIPWGEDKGDDELGGYHLVWTRDMVQCASALLAAGDTTTPLRAMIYLAIAQREDGGFYQNFWIDGHPYWTGVQLDEVSFPIIWRVAAVEGQRLGQFRSVHHGIPRLRLSDPRRAGDRRGALGRGGRLFALRPWPATSPP